MTYRISFITLMPLFFQIDPVIAATIEFDDLANSNPISYITGYEADGFVFSNDPGSGTSFGVWGKGLSYNADPDRATLLSFSPAPTIVQRIDKKPFYFSRIKLAEWYNNVLFFNTYEIDFIFSDGSAQTIVMDAIPGLQTFSFDKSAITFFSFVSRGQLVQFDDVEVESSTIASVPEPATWTTMISGFGLVGGMARRRRETCAAA